MSDRWDDKHALARELVALVECDPIHATMDCSMALLQLQQERDEALNHLLCVPYAVALYLLTHWDAWLQYIKTPTLWAHRRRKRPNPKPRRDMDHGRVLSLVFEATFAGLAGKGYQRGWWYARCLEDAFSRNIPPSDLPAHIDACGGLKNMYRWAVKNNPRRRPKDLDADDPYFDLRDTKPQPGQTSENDPQADTADPKPHNQGDGAGETPPQPDPGGDEGDGEKPIQLSPKLRRKCQATPDGEALVVVVKHRHDGTWIGLPSRGKRKKSKTSASGWQDMRILPDAPDLPDFAYSGWRSAPERWETYKPWERS